MTQRVHSVRLRACLAVVAVLLAAPALAQLPTTITISDPQGEIADLLDRGRQLEQQQRWGEALAHYEDAVRRHPKAAALQQHFDSAGSTTTWSAATPTAASAIWSRPVVVPTGAEPL